MTGAISQRERSASVKATLSRTYSGFKSAGSTPSPAARRSAPRRAMSAAFGSAAMACASTSIPGKRRELGVRREASTDAAIAVGARQAHAIRRRDLQRPERVQAPHRVGGEAAPVDLAHARIETGDDAIRPRLDRGKCQRLEARHRHHGQSGAKAESLRDGHADAHPGERAGADARGNPVELRQAHPRLAEHGVDQGQDLLGMSARRLQALARGCPARCAARRSDASVEVSIASTRMARAPALSRRLRSARACGPGDPPKMPRRRRRPREADSAAAP